MKRNSQQGVALVITLILLSVITFMAVTFLVLSRRGSEQVDTSTQQVITRNAANAAYEQAVSRIIADMIARDNGFDFGLQVSTNYQSPVFTNGITNIANVNYTNASGVFLPSIGGIPYQLMLANQMILPRPPVFIITNKAFPPDFRFYLDLNRNGTFDPTGWMPETNDFGNVIRDTNNSPVINYHVGDPQWIGVLEHPDQPHSSSNQYIARWCFIAVPIGNSLDLNAIHNQVKQFGPNVDGYLRNEGVGSWEINLAGFLAALNPNVWNTGALPYNYQANPLFPSTGVAFNDAAKILQYRYNGGFNNLNSFSGLYGVPATFFTLLGGINIDGYSAGPLMTNFSLPQINYLANVSWSGADNPNHFFTSQDLFNILSGINTFAAHLQGAGTSVSTFNRNTYYRLLSQMGTDSAPEDTNKLNLNYVNVGGISATNFIPWPALNDGGLTFFTNAVDRLLKSQPDFADLSVTNIPIYPTNRYTPAVHRLVQLAANIYDATGIRPFDGNFANDGLSYPSVFRPVFGVNGTNIYISGYTYVGTNTNALNFAHPVDVTQLINANTTNLSTNVYGIPWIIGARKGFPNLNKMVMQGTFSLTRKLRIVKNSSNPTDRSLWQTNTQYGLGISNTVGVQAWNSYGRAYPRTVNVVCYDDISVGLTNQAGPPVPVPALFTNFVFRSLGPNIWPAFPVDVNHQPGNSFVVAMNATNAILPGAVLHPNGTFTITTNVNSVQFDPTTGYPQPAFLLNITNRVWLYMVDGATGRVIDFVEFNGMTSQRDLLSELPGTDDYGPGGVWDTNRVGGSTNTSVPILGIQNQVNIAQHDPTINGGYTQPGYTTPVTKADWDKAGIPSTFSSVGQAATNFQQFYNNDLQDNPNLVQQVPFTPTRSVSVYYNWQANDPLVHYTLGDLTPIGDFAAAAKSPATNYDNTITNLVQTNLQMMSDRYLPWAGTGNKKFEDYTSYIYNLALMDPQITRSDDWLFPTNAFPNIGWLGRVHRGTPWQTVYMKSPTVDHGLWQNWSGNALTNYPGFGGFAYNDSADAEPISDRAIFDLFTTAPNDNATRGQLPVNQTNFAAWAAVMAGSIVITNDPNNSDQTSTYGPWVIDPNANAAALVQIVSDINAQRVSTNITGGVNFPGGVFTRLGDVLSTPSLTVNSPFVNTNVNDPGGFPNDMAIERIPQQVMSLLRVGQPRYVIYAYGQSLKPADKSLVTSGQFYGLCQNYQITGEVATRTVVRFEPSAPLNPTNRFTAQNPTRNPAMPGEKFLLPGQTNTLFLQPPPRAVIESFTLLPPE